MMQDAALIQVEVTEYNDAKTYGTAYLINADCAITALHVVQNYKAIQFNFSNDVAIRDADQFELVYPVIQDECLDIAVVRFSPAEGVPLPEVKSVLVGANSRVEDGWHGAGFPKFAEDGEARPIEELKGTCYRLPDNGEVVDLACDKWAKIDRWGGVSGAPVFLNKNGHLVAIITQHARALRNTHFKAVPLSVIFSDAEFSKCFIDPQKIDVLTQATLALLKKNSALLEVFPEIEPEDVVSTFQAGDIEQFFERVDSLSGAVSSKVASEFTLQCLPHFFIDQSVIIDGSLLGSDIIDLDCVADVSAECAMAAFSGRPANLSCDENSGQQPYIARGSYALAPESGIDNPELELSELTNQLLSFSALEDIAESRSELDKNVQSHLAKFAMGKSNVVEYVNRKLERDKSKRKYYYYIVSLNAEEPQSVVMREKISRYKINYPSLIFINLKKRDDLPFKEGALYEYLPELITE